MSSMMGGFGSTGQVSGLKGTGYKQINIQGDPRTAELWQQLRGGASPGIGAGLGQLSNMAQGGNENYWNQLEAPAKRQFGELQGQIASRFSGMGSGGRRSSGFQNAQSGAATDFAERLQSQRLGLQQSAIQQLLGLGSHLLGTNLSDNALVPKKQPFWKQLAMSGASGLGSLGSSAGQLGIGKAMGLF